MKTTLEDKLKCAILHLYEETTNIMYQLGI